MHPDIDDPPRNPILKGVRSNAASKMPIEIINHLMGYVGPTKPAVMIQKIQRKYLWYTQYLDPINAMPFHTFVFTLWKWKDIHCVGTNDLPYGILLAFSRITHLALPLEEP